MKRRIGLGFAAMLLLTLAAAAATPGSFRGVVVRGPASDRSDGWIFVKGKNGMLRRVEIRQAHVHYEHQYPLDKRDRSPRRALKEGVEIRVTATQGNDGEWHASEVEIVDPDEGNEFPPDPPDPGMRSS